MPRHPDSTNRQRLGLPSAWPGRSGGEIADPAHRPVKDRLPVFVAGPADAVQRLAELKICCVGCGGVGLPIIGYLARSRPWRMSGRSRRAEGRVGPHPSGHAR